jgi:hypothetical protein
MTRLDDCNRFLVDYLAGLVSPVHKDIRITGLRHWRTDDLRCVVIHDPVIIHDYFARIVRSDNRSFKGGLYAVTVFSMAVVSDRLEDRYSRLVKLKRNARARRLIERAPVDVARGLASSEGIRLNGGEGWPLEGGWQAATVTVRTLRERRGRE